MKNKEEKQYAERIAKEFRAILKRELDAGNQIRLHFILAAHLIEVRAMLRAMKHITNPLEEFIDLREAVEQCLMLIGSSEVVMSDGESSLN